MSGEMGGGPGLEAQLREQLLILGPRGCRGVSRFGCMQWTRDGSQTEWTGRPSGTVAREE